MPTLTVPLPQRPPVLHPSQIVAEMSYGDLRGLKMLLINMPLRESSVPPEGPLGITLLGARARQYGADVTLIDLNAYRKSDPTKLAGLRWLTRGETRGLLERHFQKFGAPQIIGLSGMITTLPWQNLVASLCRELVPDAFIISGGGLATDFRANLIDWVPELDAVVHSQADDTLLILGREILKAGHLRHRHVPDLPDHICQLVGDSDGRCRFVYGGGPPKDKKGLDQLPFPAWDLLARDVDGYGVLEQIITTPVWGRQANNSSATSFDMKRSLTTVTTRGCPYECTFCHRGESGARSWTVRSPENIAAEFRWLIETYGVDFVGCVDDNGAVSAERCQALPQECADLGLRWGIHLRLDEATTERLGPMHEAGCIYGGFGAETAAAEMLKRMKKGGHMLSRGLERINGHDFPKTMIEGIRYCREVGVHANCTWIMAFPGETLEYLKTSVAFILWQVEQAAEPDSINQQMFTATAYPGTEMFEDPDCREKLHLNFGVNFDRYGKVVVDEALRHYVENLDDATKVLIGRDGRPLNFGAMPDEQFLEARGYIDSGQIAKVLDM